MNGARACAGLPIVAAFAVLFAAQNASSENVEPWLVEYQAYREALQAGDTDMGASRSASFP